MTTTQKFMLMAGLIKKTQPYRFNGGKDEQRGNTKGFPGRVSDHQRRKRRKVSDNSRESSGDGSPRPSGQDV